MRLTSVIFIFIFLSFSNLIAQKRGEPFLDDLKAVIKQAKDGDIPAMLQVADRCRGTFFANDEVRDYKQAKKWCEEAIEKEPANPLANLMLFKLFVVGNYGVEKSPEIAKQYFLKTIETNGDKLLTNYPDAYNLDLRNFFSTFEKAQVGSVEDMISLARMYYHYEISFKEAMLWIEKAKASGNEDANYLYEKWQWAKATQKDESALIAIEHRNALGKSTFASISFLLAARGKNMVQATDLETIGNNFAKIQNNELQVKANAAIAFYYTGKKQISLLRKLSENVTGTKIDEYFCKDALTLLQNLDNETKTITGLLTFAAKYQDMSNFAFSIEEYNQNYGGKIDQLLKLQQIISAPSNTAFLSASNVEAYQNELKQKAVQIVAATDNIMKFVSLKRLADVDKWLLSIPELKSAMEKQMVVLGVTAANLNFYYEKNLMEEKIFKTLDEGKRYFYYIKSSDLDSAGREKLLGMLKNKVLNDVIGSAKTPEILEKLKTASNTQGWLLPEVQNRYLTMLNENIEWFTGVVDRNDVRYLFTATLDATDKTKYVVEIKGVKNEEAHLVYSGMVKVQDLSEKSKEIRVKAFFSSNDGSTWRVFANDFLETSMIQGDDYLKFKPQGRMTSCADPTHNVPKDDIARSFVQYEFTVQNAVKTALKVMILEFNKVLLPL
jgi:hypothetical protein